MNTSITKILVFTILGSAGAFIGSLVGYPIAKDASSMMEILVKTGLWDTAIVVGIGLAFVLSQSWYLKRIQSGLQGSANILGLSAIAGFAGGIALVLLRTALRGTPEMLSLVAGWSLEGAIIGFLIAPVIPNLPRLSALIAGCLAGLLGAITMVGVGAIGIQEALSVAIGDSFKGFFLGLLFTLTEKLVREAWLEVQYNPRETRTVSLGTTPVTVGSDSSATLYARNAAPLALRYQLHQGQAICEEMPAGVKRRLAPGAQQQVGNLMITFCAAYADRQLPLSPAPSHPGFTLHIQKQIIPLKQDTPLTTGDIPGLEPQGRDRIIAFVSQNPQNPDILGLKNKSHQTWVVHLPSGEHKQIAPGRTVKLAPNTRVKFGSVEGVIR
jgi:hypothetical protein